MQHLQGLLFVVILAVGYALFFHHQGDANATKPQPAPTHAALAQTDPYKASLDRARAAAQQMETSHKEADAFGAILSSR